MNRIILILTLLLLTNCSTKFELAIQTKKVCEYYILQSVYGERREYLKMSQVQFEVGKEYILEYKCSDE